MRRGVKRKNKASRMIFLVGRKGLEVEYLPYQKTGRQGRYGSNAPKLKQKLPAALRRAKFAIVIVPPGHSEEHRNSVENRER